jgi:hypothetical protein
MWHCWLMMNLLYRGQENFLWSHIFSASVEFLVLENIVLDVDENLS